MKFHRSRDLGKEEVARLALIAELERLNATGMWDTKAWVRDLRANGKRAADRFMREMVGHILQCHAYIGTNPIVRAAVVYEKQVTGVDLALAPPEQIRDRIAAGIPAARVQAARDRAYAAAAAAHDRQRDRQLAAMRQAALGKEPPVKTRRLS